jgi:nucleoid-associated protein YgaU
MMRTIDRAYLVGLMAVAAAAPLQAQQPAEPATPDAPAAVAQSSDPRLVFEREVFSYPGRARRDPFMPLTGQNAGVMFTDLTLHMILFDENPSRSIVAVSDAAKKQYRLRRGDTVGSATVVDIGRTRVVFSVNDFGIRRQEVLDMKPMGRSVPR